jgi:hypothetical protein
MKKIVWAIVASAAMALSSALPGMAMAGPIGHPGPGAHPVFGARPSFRGPQEFGGRPAFHGRQGFGEHSEFRGHHDFRGHRGFHSHVFIVNPGFGWDSGFPDYAAPPVVVAPTPPVYIQQGTPPDQAGYWYYCQNPQGYYPYITQCPAGWIAVAPTQTPPAQ